MHCVAPDIIFKIHSFEPIISTYGVFSVLISTEAADIQALKPRPWAQGKADYPGTKPDLPLCLSVGLTVQLRPGSQKTVHWRQNASLTIASK